METTQQAPIKPYSKKELLTLYEPCSDKTLSSWLKPISKQLGPYNGRKFNVRQIEIIFNHLGRPYISSDKK